MHALNKIFDHFLRRAEVSDHPILQRTDRFDFLRRAPQHQLGFVAESIGHHHPPLLPHRHHRRLIQHHPAALHIDQRVGRAEVDSHVFRHQAEQFTESEHNLFHAKKGVAEWLATSVRSPQ